MSQVPKPNRGVFTSESELLERCQRLIQTGAEDPDQLRDSLNDMTHAFEKLVRKSEKITKVGDSIQRKLVKAKQEITVKNSELEILDQIVKIIYRENELEQVFDAVLTQGLTLFPSADSAVFLLIDSDHHHVQHKSQRQDASWNWLTQPGPAPTSLIKPFHRLSKQLGAEVFPVEHETLQSLFAPFPNAEIPKAVLALILTTDETRAGLLILSSSSRKDTFTGIDLSTYNRYRDHVVLAVNKAETLRELTQKNHELVTTQRQLIMKEKMSALGSLAAGIAHEISNPLNFINNFAHISEETAQCLLDELTQNPSHQMDHEELVNDLIEIQEGTAVIRKHGHRAAQIVERMQLLFREDRARPQASDLNDLLRRYTDKALYDFRLYNSKFQPLITFETTAMPLRDVVPQDLGLVFQQLATNAFDTHLEKLNTAPYGFHPHLVVGSALTEDHIRLFFRDNGMGIPADRLEKIFSPFYTTRFHGRHVGLGLSIGYDIIEQGYRGTIEVSTEIAKGTEVTILLPRNPSAGI